MIEFLAANIGTIVIILILSAVVGMIILKLKKGKKSGSFSCGCGCGGCPNSALCHGKPISETEEMLK